MMLTLVAEGLHVHGVGEDVGEFAAVRAVHRVGRLGPVVALIRAGARRHELRLHGVALKW